MMDDVRKINIVVSHLCLISLFMKFCIFQSLLLQIFGPVFVLLDLSSCYSLLIN